MIAWQKVKSLARTGKTHPMRRFLRMAMVEIPMPLPNLFLLLRYDSSSMNIKGIVTGFAQRYQLAVDIARNGVMSYGRFSLSATLTDAVCGLDNCSSFAPMCGVVASDRCTRPGSFISTVVQFSMNSASSVSKSRLRASWR
jgi:hypothetical protein